jgi:ribosomal protein S18 acetylase RimI-like enzyme
MTIVPASPALCRSIAEVHVLSWQKAYSTLLPRDYLATLSVEQREEMWRASLERGTPQVLVAADAGSVVGFVAFGPSRDEGAPSNQWEVWALYLKPEQWSRGVGRELWLSALAQMRNSGVSAVTLWVIAGNERAIKFYSAAGFSEKPHSAQEFSLGGVQLHEVRYAKRIDG